MHVKEDVTSVASIAQMLFAECEARGLNPQFTDLGKFLIAAATIHTLREGRKK